MADPELQIKGGGGGHPDTEISGAGHQKTFLQPFGPQFGVQISVCVCGWGGGGGGVGWGGVGGGSATETARCGY